MAVKLDFLGSTQFQETTIQPSGYLYKDLSLDLDLEYSTSSSLLRSNNIKDFVALQDADAVINSLKNILLTSPGQKILAPTFGIDLRRYLFYPANNRIGYLIGLEFSEKLTKFEPRISIQNVEIILQVEDNAYEVNVSFTIPFVESNKKFTLKGKLNSDGYTVL